jgi:hypothetical protein
MSEKHPLQILEDVQIATPCDADWSRMEGDDRVRHCGLCDRKVFNLSALSAEDAVALVRREEGRLCVRLYERSDGTVLTADCPRGLRLLADRVRHAWLRSFRFVAVAVAGLLFGVPFAEARSESQVDHTAKMGKVVSPPKPPRKPKKVHAVKPPKIERRKLFVI